MEKTEVNNTDYVFQILMELLGFNKPKIQGQEVKWARLNILQNNFLKVEFSLWGFFVCMFGFF